MGIVFVSQHGQMHPLASSIDIQKISKLDKLHFFCGRQHLHTFLFPLSQCFFLLSHTQQAFAPDIKDLFLLCASELTKQNKIKTYNAAACGYFAHSFACFSSIESMSHINCCQINTEGTFNSMDPPIALVSQKCFDLFALECIVTKMEFEQTM